VIAILPLLLVMMPVAADLQVLLNRAGEEAEMFHQNITLVIGQETLKQRAEKRATRFRPHVGRAAQAPINFQTRELTSEYAVVPFAESNGSFHEVRKVTHVDGRQIQPLREARMSLAMGMKSADDKLRRKLLLEFEKHGLIGTAVDFGLSLLLFRKQAMLNYTFFPAGPRQLGAETVEVVRFKQKSGEGVAEPDGRAAADRVGVGDSGGWAADYRCRRDRLRDEPVWVSVAGDGDSYAARRW